MQIKINSEQLEVVAGENLLEILRRHQQPVANICNGRGTCGKCKVRVSGECPEPTEQEYGRLSAGEIAAGIRLACLTYPCEGMEVINGQAGWVDRKGQLFIPDQFKTGNSGLQRVTVSLDLPSLADERGDWDRLQQKIEETCTVHSLTIALPQLQGLATTLRQENFCVQALLWRQRILTVQPGQAAMPVFGIAVDIGTTNVAVALYDMEAGSRIGLAAAENAQTQYGGDVISRIEFANRSPDNRQALRKAITGTINQLISQLCNDARIRTCDIFKAVLVGNTTMHHLFLGLDVSHLALSPFVSTCNTALEITAGEADLALNDQARALLFPNVGGFVGGDTLGAVLGAEELMVTGRHLLIDIGTNCELYLQDGPRMWACSTAAGPAFEGAGIRYGMRAQPGAIERVNISAQTVEISVIGGEKTPVGICGSGLIEAVQQMRQAGIINPQGAISDPDDPKVKARLSPELLKRIRNGVHCREFVLAYSGNGGDDVTLSQRDISQLQLAKGAVCAGIRTLLANAGLKLQELDSVVLAGTFAAHLNLASTVDIGLIPCLSMHKLKTAGNAAHVGAIKALLDQHSFERLQKRTRAITHVELGGSSTFSTYFMESMYIEPCRM